MLNVYDLFHITCNMHYFLVTSLAEYRNSVHSWLPATLKLLPVSYGNDIICPGDFTEQYSVVANTWNIFEDIRPPQIPL